MSSSADQPVIHAYKLDRAGMARLFGELEAAVMEVIWRLGSATVTTVSGEVDADVQYTTIQTVMNRLTEKGMLVRTLLAPGGAYLYQPAEEREAFLSRVSRELVRSLLADFGDAAVSGLVDAMDAAEPDQLAALEATIRERGQRGEP